jgi:hypothetical protein
MSEKNIKTPKIDKNKKKYRNRNHIKNILN